MGKPRKLDFPPDVKEDDTPSIYEQKMAMAREMYVEYDRRVDDIVAHTGLSKEAIWDRIYHRNHPTTKKKGPWIQQKKDLQKALVEDTSISTKMKISDAYKEKAIISAHIDKNIKRLLKKKVLSATEIKMLSELRMLADTYSRGLSCLHKITLPIAPNPLVNINMNQKEVLSEDTIEATLKDWGVNTQDDNGTAQLN